MNLPSMVHKLRGLLIFLLLAGIVTILSGMVYAGTQQIYRSDANDPQVEASEEIINALNQGAPADAIVNSAQALNISRTLSPFVIIFDKDAKVVASSGKLGDQTPTPPSGVFDKLRDKGQNNFTWQPEKDVRIAAVMRKADGDKGFVLVGRNLREVERREYQLFKLLVIGWVVSLAICALLAWLLNRNTSTNVTVVEENIVVETPPQE
jgi:hypothetical protein